LGEPVETIKILGDPDMMRASVKSLKILRLGELRGCMGF
jgi:hypothetical protein